MKLEELLKRPGVVSVWEWSLSSREGSFGAPEVKFAAGRTRPELAELGAIYMELLAHLANFEASLLDRRAGQALFAPVEAIAFEGSRYTVVATGNRVAVVLDDSAREDFWELTEAMAAIHAEGATEREAP